MQLEVTIPSSLKEVKLKDYQDYLTIEEPTVDDMLKCILNINQRKLGKIKANDIDYLSSYVVKLFKQDQELIPTFKINRVEYGFIPDLEEITYGENKDITSYLNDWKNMHKAMAVLFRPVIQKQGNKYRIEEYEGSHYYSEIMKEMPLNVVMGAMVFFYNLTNVLLKYIPSYMEKELTKEQMHGVISQENGLVIQKYIHSLNQTLQNLNKLQSFPYINA